MDEVIEKVIRLTPIFVSLLLKTIVVHRLYWQRIKFQTWPIIIMLISALRFLWIYLINYNSGKED